jgi:hypothetical protein
MTQLVSHRSPTAKAQVQYQVSSLRFVVHKVARGQVFLRVLLLSHHCHSTHTHTHSFFCHPCYVKPQQLTASLRAYYEKQRTFC